MVQRTSTNAYLTARELAEKVDESYNTIDHWTLVGLLPCERRGRTRRYGAAESVQRCKLIRQFQNEGYTLQSIAKELVALLRKDE